MPLADLGDIRLNYRIDGDPEGAPVVFAHALGTDLTLWNAVIPLLPQSLCLIRYDLRGHGQSDCPPGPYAMGTLVRDAERLIEHLGKRDTMFVGLSIGGMIAQGLATKRLDLVRAMVLSNTAVKIGTKEIWEDRIATVEKSGIEALADPTMERWFPHAFRASGAHQPWRDLMTGQNPEGYKACCAAIAGTDFITPTSGLRLPTLCIAGSEDRSTPPDMLRETAGLIHGARFEMIRRAGHLPCVDQPEAYATALTTFIKETGHMEPAHG